MMLILASVALVVLETTLDADHAYVHLLHWIDYSMSAVFVVELSIRFYVARRKRRFFRRYWLDIIAVLPVMRSLRFLRLIRLLRMFRIGILLNRRLSNISSVFAGAAGESIIIGLIVLITILFGAVGLRVTEGVENAHFATLEQTAWWSVLSLVAAEPIGPTPQTLTGRILALLVMLSGMTVFAMMTGTMSALMVNRLKAIDHREIEIEDLRGHVVICGWNSSGRLIVQELVRDADVSRNGIVVCAEFAEEEEPALGLSESERANIFLMRGDYTRQDVLKRAGVPHASKAILLADRTLNRSDQDRDARSALAAITIERLNKEIFTTVELTDRDNGQHLKYAGVEEIVVAEEYAGKIIAMGARNNGIATMIDELLSANRGNEFLKGPVSRLKGRTVGDAAHVIRRDHNAMLVGLEVDDNEEGRRIILNPPNDRIIQASDYYVAIGRTPFRL